MRLAAALCVTLLIASTAPAKGSAKKTVYHGLTLVDPVSETRTPDSYIVVEGHRIVRVGRGAPPASIPVAQRRDMKGRFAMPGLFDTHAHVTVGPLALTRADGKVRAVMKGDEAMTRHDALMLLAHGVTTIRDPGGDTKRMVAYRNAVAAGMLLGPEAKVAGGVIDRPPFPTEGLVDSVTDAEPVAAVVRRQAALGVDFIKLYEGLTPDDLKAGVAAAQAARLQTVAHLSDVSWKFASELGMDSFVHAMPLSPDLLSGKRRDAFLSTQKPGAYDFYRWYEEVDLDGPEVAEMIATLARRKTSVDATLIVFKLAFWGDHKALRNRDLAKANPSLAQNWTQSFRFDLGWTPEDYRRAKAIWPKVLRFVRMLHNAGVPLTIGTDMNNPFVAPGASVAREMKLHIDAGIRNWDVLRMATINAARLLKIDGRTGRLRPGMEADILILEDDPSVDIEAVSGVVAVVENGRFHRPQDLMAMATGGQATLMLGSSGATSSSGCERCTPDAVVSTLYDEISVSPGEKWNWTKIRSLFAGDGLFASTVPLRPNSPLAISSLDTLARRTEAAFAQTGFVEREYKRETRVFGNMASVYSSFYVKINERDKKPLARGLHHFQLLKGGEDWKIVSNASIIEEKDWQLPARFLP